MTLVTYSRCPWCRMSCHDAIRMQRHIAARRLTGECDPDNLRRPIEEGPSGTANAVPNFKPRPRR